MAEISVRIEFLRASGFNLSHLNFFMVVHDIICYVVKQINFHNLLKSFF